MEISRSLRRRLLRPGTILDDGIRPWWWDIHDGGGSAERFVRSLGTLNSVGFHLKKLGPSAAKALRNARALLRSWCVWDDMSWSL